jgi:hypothetical protein
MYDKVKNHDGYFAVAVRVLGEKGFTSVCGLNSEVNMHHVKTVASEFRTEGNPYVHSSVAAISQ